MVHLTEEGSENVIFFGTARQVAEALTKDLVIEVGASDKDRADVESRARDHKDKHTPPPYHHFPEPSQKASEEKEEGEFDGPDSGGQ